MGREGGKEGKGEEKGGKTHDEGIMSTITSRYH